LFLERFTGTAGTAVHILTQVLQEADTETDEGLEELVSDVALALLRSEVIPQAPPPNPKTPNPPAE